MIFSPFIVGNYFGQVTIEEGEQTEAFSRCRQKNLHANKVFDKAARRLAGFVIITECEFSLST